MNIQCALTEYLIGKYHPEALIVYGSFADGSQGEHSDFDAVIIADEQKGHDSSIVDGTQLDVFIYPPEFIDGEPDPEEFVQIWDGKIVLDREGRAARLKERVLAYIQERNSSEDEIRESLAWCEKMLARTTREDAEGLFRWHWLLTESLQIWCEARGLYYFGPKKMLKRMQRSEPRAYEIYSEALKNFTQESLQVWIAYLKQTCTEKTEENEG